MAKPNKKDKKKLKKKQRQQKQAPASRNEGFLSNLRGMLTRTQWIAVIGVLIITFLAFSSSLDNAFVNWDDDRNFYENENITSLNKENFWENTRKIFSSDVIGNYNPIPIFSFLIENKLFGLDQPFYWHLDNVLLHLICVFLVFLIGTRLGLNYLGAGLLALLFGIHPMRVESVAWITERKDVLFGLFYLWALLIYIKHKKTETISNRVILKITILFLLSLLSKIQAVILPVSLILVDYWFDNKITLRHITRKIPWFLISLFFGVLGIFVLQGEGSLESNATYPLIQRVFIGSYTLVVYLIKSVVPYQMSPLYPYPSSLTPWHYASIVSFIGMASVLYWTYIKDKKVWFFGLGFFMVNIVFMLQILGAGQGYLADRFTYMAYFGLYFIAGYYFDKYSQGKPLKVLTPGLILVFAITSAYSVMTFQQNKIWKNSATLWTHVLNYYTKTTLPYGNRANYYRDAGLTELALIDYNKVISLDDSKPGPYNSLARLYFNYNIPDSLVKALTNYNKAIELNPNDVEYHVNRGATYAKLGDGVNALVNLNAAEKIDPNFANIYLNRSIIHNGNGNYPQSLRDIDKYISIKPYVSDIWYEKCRLHNALNQSEQALDACNRAISLRNNKGVYYFEKGRSLYFLQRQEEAKSALQLSQQLGYQGDPELTSRILNSFN